MIQRIQHVFMLLSAVATGLLIIKPLVAIEVAGTAEGLMFANGLKSVGAGEIILPSLPLILLICLITVLSLVCIFLYKKRLLQLRLTVYNMILMVCFIGIAYFYASLAADELSGDIKLTYFTIMPVIAFIWSLLAWRGIRRDYLMLKAVERIR